MKLRIHYNAPVTLTFALICTSVFIINYFTRPSGYGWLDPIATLKGSFYPGSLMSYLSSVFYIFNHGDFNHLIGNMGFILLLGPILEEKYGKRSLILMILVTTIATAIFNFILFGDYLIGASGIVFMFIMLVSFANVTAGRIPLTFILVLLLFVGKEVVNGFDDNNVSEFGHIVGGICGSFFGFSKIIQWKKKHPREDQSPPEIL